MSHRGGSLPVAEAVESVEAVAVEVEVLAMDGGPLVDSSDLDQ